MAKKNDEAQISSQLQEKWTKVSSAIAGLEKVYGKGTIMRLNGENEGLLQFETISTGSLALDFAVGVGGYPRGRVIEIYGPESSGKTTLALHAIAECQKAGGIAAFVDAEHALDPKYAANLGVKMEDLVVSQPDNGEQALNVTESLVTSGGIDLIVVDSVAALVPKAEIEGEMGDAQMGLQARLMSQAMRKLVSVVHNTKTIVIFINQIRMKIGVRFGSPETTTGGNALKFYATMRLDIRKIGTLKEGGGGEGEEADAVGNRVRVKVAKNKVSAPFKEVEFDIIYGHGVSREGEIVDVAEYLKVVEKSGSWYAFNGERIGQGRNNVIEMLKTNKALKDKIVEAIHFARAK